MQHLIVFYFILAFSLGIMCLFISSLFYFKTRDRLLGSLLFFYSSFTLFVFLNLILSYMRVNIGNDQSILFRTLDYIEASVAKFLLLFSIPQFIHLSYDVPKRKIKNTVIGIVTLVTFTVEHYSSFVIAELDMKKSVTFLSDFIFMVVLVYAFIIGIYNQRRLKDRLSKRISRWIFILFGILLPGFIYDTILGFIHPFRFYPLFYIVHSIFISFYLLRRYIGMPRKGLPENSFFKKHNISEREKEIIRLIVKGYSNERIADTLCISLNTVKTHIRNFYPKMGVKSRFELLSLMQNTPKG